MLLYRALLHLYPKSFRAEYGDEILGVIDERRRAAPGIAARITLFVETLSDTGATAARVHADILGQDVRYAVRALRRSPSFAATAILLTAIGIGATTAAVAVADHVLLRPLPYPDADRLVRFWQRDRQAGGRDVLSPGNYRDLAAAARSFESVAAYTPRSANLVGEGAPLRLDGYLATGDLFRVVGRRPALGRGFTPGDDAESAPPVVVLSHGTWRTHFGEDPAIVGRTISLNGTMHAIVGVMPADFMFPDRRAEFWAPLRLEPGAFEDRSDTFLWTVARLGEDRTIAQAESELNAVASELERQFPRENARLGVSVAGLRGTLAGADRLTVIVVAVAALGLLLIACINLAGLLLSRGLSRQRELAVRAAIGAGRERLLRQMLTESSLLAAAGGVLGVLLAIASTPLLARLVPTTLPMAESPSMDWRFVGLAVAATLLTVVAFGVLPARRAAAGSTPDALRETTRTGPGRRTETLRGGLVVAQVAVSVVLVVSVGLLGRALWQVHTRDPGFDPRNVLTLRTALPWPKYGPTAERVAFYDRVLERIRALPGVDSAGYITGLPMIVSTLIWEVQAEGGAALSPRENTVGLRFVTPGYFDAMGIPIRDGRDISPADTRESPFVAVVSESFAERHWPGQRAVGRRFNVAFFDRIVVGIAGDVRVRGLEREAEPQVYMAAPQVPDFGLLASPPKDLAIRTRVPAATLLPAVRRILHDVDPEQPISNVRMLDDVLADQLAPRATQLRVLSGFAAVAMLVASIGLYGLLAFGVSRRVREIGLRMALGATPAAIVGLIVRRGVLLTALGAALGTAGAYAASRWLQALLAGVSPLDPVTYAASLALVIVLALGATIPPALRAARVSPLEATRE
ncbi:MAG: ABC transporter permease [Acidobacteria bacterium]|nr:ABC transporter permease [Acidobacteriota bacterium]